MASPSSQSLSRRLIGVYLMFGLACLLVVIAGPLALASQGQLPNVNPYAVVVPVAILVAGAVALRRTVQLHTDIESQLTELAYQPNAATQVLERVRDAKPIGAGWNTLIEQISSRSALQSLEARLEQTLGGETVNAGLDILDALPEGIATTDAEGTITFSNRALVRLLGDDPESSIIGTSLLERLVSQTTIEVDDVWERFEASTRSLVMELRLGPTTAVGVLRVARYALRTGSNGEEGHLWSIRDVTQQKLAEEMRNQFVFTATHELRTPLANIKAYAETLAAFDDIDVTQQQEFYNTITAEATRLGRFVDELLDVSQMESGSVSLRKHETNIERLVEEVSKHVMPEARRKQIDFELRLPPKMPKLNVDKDKVAASLVNLLGNAIKYTPDEGKVRLEVVVNEHDVEFHVEDTGYGISEEELPKLFEKFFRSDDARVREISGSGLGLAFTQDVARLHGGKVTALSELNKGSRFVMTLPLPPKPE